MGVSDDERLNVNCSICGVKYGIFDRDCPKKCHEKANIEKEKIKDYLLKVEVNNKYTVVQMKNGSLKALRYGEEWRDCTGDGLILSLAQELESSRNFIL